MAPQYEMAVGLKKGHKVTKLQQKPRPSRRRGVSAECMNVLYTGEDKYLMVAVL